MNNLESLQEACRKEIEKMLAMLDKLQAEHRGLEMQIRRERINRAPLSK